MKFRVLPILNSFGCLLLTVLVVVQWVREQDASQRTFRLHEALATARELSSSESQRATTLENDIAILKESLLATQKSFEQSAASADESIEVAEQLKSELNTVSEQVRRWQVAIAERDSRLLELDKELLATRERLSVAIAKLKAAGER